MAKKQTWEEKAQARLAEQRAVIPTDSRFSMEALPTGPHLVEDYPVLSLVNYFRQSGRITTDKGQRSVDFVRGGFSLFRGVQEPWGAQALNISALHEASFDKSAFEAENPDVKEKVDAAREAVTEWHNRDK